MDTPHPTRPVIRLHSAVAMRSSRIFVVWIRWAGLDSRPAEWNDYSATIMMRAHFHRDRRAGLMQAASKLL